MPIPLRQSAWWTWLLPMLFAADLPLLSVGLFTAYATDNSLFMLWGWFSVILVTAVTVWVASRDVSYGYWAGILTCLTGVCMMVLYRLLCLHRQDVYDRLERVPQFLRAALTGEITLVRDLGLLPIVVGALFLAYDAFSQRRS